VEVRAFWSGWLAWSRERGIDYYIGRTLAPRLAAYGLKEIEGTAETAIYNGGSQWADYWRKTITELRGDLIQSGKLKDALVDVFLAHCANSNWWTQTIAFTAVHARAPVTDGERISHVLLYPNASHRICTNNQDP
jgi:hypothetical protein